MYVSIGWVGIRIDRQTGAGTYMYMHACARTWETGRAIGSFFIFLPSSARVLSTRPLFLACAIVVVVLLSATPPPALTPYTYMTHPYTHIHTYIHVVHIHAYAHATPRHDTMSAKNKQKKGECENFLGAGATFWGGWIILVLALT